MVAATELGAGLSGALVQAQPWNSCDGFRVTFGHELAPPVVVNYHFRGVPLVRRRTVREVSLAGLEGVSVPQGLTLAAETVGA